MPPFQLLPNIPTGQQSDPNFFPNPKIPYCQHSLIRLAMAGLLDFQNPLRCKHPNWETICQKRPLFQTGQSFSLLSKY